MAQQKACVLLEKFGAFAVQKIDIPKPAPGDILVKVMATALNPVDWKTQKYGVFQDTYPALLGVDVAGVVEQVGEGVTAFKKGDRVFHEATFQNKHAPAINEQAGFQEYTTVPAEIAAKIPDNISFEQAASIPLGIFTAAISFYNPIGQNGAGLTPPWEPAGEGKYKGQGILIFGGSSSVGQYAIQLASLSGFSPIAVTASAHNSGLVKSLGATHFIDRKADVAAEAAKIFTTPLSIVFDAISEGTQEAAWKALAPGGTLILMIPAEEAIKSGEDGKTAFVAFGMAHVHRDLGRSLFSKLPDLLQAGKVKPNAVEVLPGGLAGIEAGLKRMSENKVSGVKLVVRPPETP
ncbi:GroES-like protein [Gautieria morchelliformis]|nr:GroES-like protein [Gautieria morchelliformis]